MKYAGCEREPDVAAAVRASRLEGDLERHAASCAACRESAAVARFLGELARQPIEPAPLDAAELYRRARLLERLFREPAPVAVTLRRLALAEVVGVVVSGSALFTWLVGAGSDLATRLSLGPSVAMLSEWASPHFLFAGIAALSIVAALPVLAAWPLLRAED